MIRIYRQIDIDTQIDIDIKVHRQIDRASTFVFPCTNDYIFAPMDDDRPCFKYYHIGGY